MKESDENVNDIVEKKVCFPLSSQFFKINYNNNRRNAVHFIAEILLNELKFNDWTYDKQTEMVKKIEQKVYSETREKGISLNIRLSWQNEIFVKIYDVILYKVASNLDPNSMIGSRYVIDNLLNGVINPENLADMDSLDLCPDKHIDIIEKLKNRKETKIDYRYSKFVSCKTCLQYTCVERFVQKRCADEAPTAVYDCVKCDAAKMKIG
jgi:DNA-directed RNA polymerase subunit M/transcription elongation factor TFIIS